MSATETRKATFVDSEEETAERVREWLNDAGHVAYTVLGHVTSSGMTRHIGVKLLVPSERPGRVVDVLYLDYNVAALVGSRVSDRGVKREGAGMDMGFDLIYSLGRVLYPDGHPCWGPDVCQSNEHVNPGPERDDYSPDRIHRDGGYGIRQEWL